MHESRFLLPVHIESVSVYEAVSFIVRPHSDDRRLQLYSGLDRAKRDFRQRTLDNFLDDNAEDIFGAGYAKMPNVIECVRNALFNAPLKVVLIRPIDLGGNLEDTNMLLVLDSDDQRLKSDLDKQKSNGKDEFRRGQKIYLTLPNPVLNPNVEGLPIINDDMRLRFLSVPLSKHTTVDLRDRGFFTLAHNIDRYRTDQEIAAVKQEFLARQRKCRRNSGQQGSPIQPRRESRPSFVR